MITISVPAMDSRQCVRAVSARLSDVPGVQTLEADLSRRTVRVTGPADPAAVAAAIRGAGYAVDRCTSSPTRAAGTGGPPVDTSPTGCNGSIPGPTLQVPQGSGTTVHVTDEARVRLHRGPRSHVVTGWTRRSEELIAFPVYPGVTPLDLVGPLTVLRNMVRTPHRTVVVGERAEELATDTALRLVPAATFAEVPEPFAVFVPGGGSAVEAAMRNEPLLGYLRSAAAGAELVGATGNGSLVLGAAGLLGGRRAAAHWAWGGLLETTGATWARERWVEDGRFLTAAGGSSGIDVMLALRARLESRSGARMAQLFIEYDPEPPFGRVEPGDGDGELARLLRQPPGPAAAATEEGGERLIAFVLYPGLTVLDLVGPLQVLTALERLAPGHRTVVVGARREPVPTDVGVATVPDRTFEAVPNPSIVVVPGGSVPTIRAMGDPVVRDYVRTAAASADLVTSVCTGSLILGAVGLLDGRDATTNWFYSGVLESLGATYRRRRWVDDGRVVTSAGVSAGIDMALHLAARLTDEATARRVQQALDYDPQPPFGGIDYGHIHRLPWAMRGAIGLTAPAIAARSRRLTRAGL